MIDDLRCYSYWCYWDFPCLQKVVAATDNFMVDDYWLLNKYRAYLIRLERPQKIYLIWVVFLYLNFLGKDDLHYSNGKS